MNQREKISVFVSILLVLAFALPVLAQDGPPPPPEIDGAEIIAEGFTSAQGLVVDADGNVWVVDGGVGGDQMIDFTNPNTGEIAPSPMGMTSRIAYITPDGDIVDVAVLPSVVAGTDFLGGARLALSDGTLYATSGQWIASNGDERMDLMGAVVSIDADGTVTEVANTWAFELDNNPDGLLVDSHPYGVTAGPDGWLWVADAGANSLYRVDPATGDIEGVTGFDGLPGPFPNPNRDGAMETDPVPTAVAFDADGNAYVSYLTGFPFIPGSAMVVKVSADGEVTPYATGMTMLTDLQVAPDGTMYAVSFGMFTAEGPVFNSGMIVRIQEGEGSQIVVDGLPFPTGLAFDADGNGYVTINSVGAPGSGAVMKINDLVGREGMPLPSPVQPGA